MGRNQQQKGGYARKPGIRPYMDSTGNSERMSNAMDDATVLGLGAPPLTGITGLQGLTQPSSLDSLFGSTGLNPLAQA